MGCGDAVCGVAPAKSSLLYLWYDVLTLFQVVTYLQFVFGVWAFLVVIGCYDMM